MRVTSLTGRAGGLDDESVMAGVSTLLPVKNLPVYGSVATGGVGKYSM